MSDHPPKGVSPLIWARLGAIRGGAAWHIPERDEHGAIIGTAIRSDCGRKHMKPGSGRGLTMLWPMLVEAGESPENPILIVEGQTDCAVGIDLGYFTIGRPSASGGKAIIVAIVRGRHIVICAENDESGTGRREAKRLASELVGIAASVKVIFPPEGATDLRAWYIAPAPVSTAELKRLIERTPTLSSPAIAPSSPGRQAEPVIVRLSDVEPEPVRWLWPGCIALGKLTMIVGDPGLGKSFLTLDMAARVSTGTPWPDAIGESNPAGGVVLLSVEDAIADTIRPRLDAAGADVSRIIALRAVQRGDGSARMFNLATDLAALDDAIVACHGCRLVVVDPISAYLGMTDSHRNADMRSLLAPLADLSARHGVAIVAVSHLNKSGGGKAIYRIMGSLAFIAAARACWAVVRDPDDPTRRLLLPVKNNLATDSGGLAYTVRDAGCGIPSIAWDSQPVSITADEALGRELETNNDETRRTAVDDAADWLRNVLSDGPLPAIEIKRQALANSISATGSLRRAHDRLKVDAIKRGPFDKPTWYWRMPGDTREPALQTQDVQPTTVDAQSGRHHSDLHAGAGSVETTILS